MFVSSLISLTFASPGSEVVMETFGLFLQPLDAVEDAVMSDS